MPLDNQVSAPSFDYDRAAALWCDSKMYNEGDWYSFPPAPDAWTIGGNVSCPIMADRLAHKYVETTYGAE